jgi:hypothetical protein
MKSSNSFAACLLVLGLLLAAPPGATEQADKDEWIEGKLFGPELILKYQSNLKLTEKQRDMIGAELKRVQAQAAESDWLLMTEASQLQILIDQHPVDAKAVLTGVDRVFEAENRKKRLFMEMLINIKNMLTSEQVNYLRSVTERP